MIDSDSALETARSQVERSLADASLCPEIKGFFDEGTFTVTYVVHDRATSEAAVIDPVLDFDPASGRTSHTSADEVVEYVKSNNLKVSWLLETHAHADHLSAAPYLQQKLGGQLAIGHEILTVQAVFGKIFNEGTDFRRDGSQFDQLFNDGDRFEIGGLQAMALHVPGHTPACLASVVGDAGFPGDTMFMPDYGTARCDFPGGDARTLYRSIHRLTSLPDEARVFLCHDYKAPPGRTEFAWETTIGAQRTGNIHIRDDVSEDEFVAMRTQRDATLPMPKLILPSVQVNMNGGRPPEPEDNGVRYLKVPLNAL